MRRASTIIVLPANGVFAEFRVLRGTPFQQPRYNYVNFGCGTPTEEVVRANVINTIISTVLAGLIAILRYCERNEHVFPGMAASLKRVYEVFVRNYYIGSTATGGFTKVCAIEMSAVAQAKDALPSQLFYSFADLHFDGVPRVAPDYGHCRIEDRLRDVHDLFQAIVPYNLDNLRTTGAIDARITRDQIVFTFATHVGSYPLKAQRVPNTGG